MKPGFAPHFGYWGAITIVLGIALSLYSARAKSERLLALNWLTVPVICLAVLGVTWLLNPQSVGQNAGMVLFFSVFTFGMPLWVPLAALVWHFVSCSALPNG